LWGKGFGTTETFHQRVSSKLERVTLKENHEPTDLIRALS
jgi:hypothetical protein